VDRKEPLPFATGYLEHFASGELDESACSSSECMVACPEIRIFWGLLPNRRSTARNEGPHGFSLSARIEICAH
jgi:hypothetical protein